MNSLDILGYRKRLEAVGVPCEQAEVHAKMLAEVVAQVAAKDDLASFEVRKKKSEQLGSNTDIAGWMLAIAIAQTSLIIAALRYLPH
jgi:hypothetical protein